MNESRMDLRVNAMQCEGTAAPALRCLARCSNAGRGVRESRKRIAKKDLDSCWQEAMTGGFTGLEQGERASR